MIRRYTTQGLSCRDLKPTRRIAHQVGVLVSLSSNPSATPSGNILRLMRAFRTYLYCFLGGQNHRWIHQGFVEPFVSKLPSVGANGSSNPLSIRPWWEKNPTSDQTLSSASDNRVYNAIR